MSQKWIYAWWAYLQLWKGGTGPPGLRPTEDDAIRSLAHQAWQAGLLRMQRRLVRRYSLAD